MKADAGTEKEILGLLEDYAEGYAAKEMDRILKHVAADPDVVFIGTGPDEWETGLDDLRSGFERDFKQAEDIHLEFTDVMISSAGEVAWLSSKLNFRVLIGDNKIIIHGRFTGVLERREGRWLFVQGHYSVPASDQPRGQSYPID
jgi:ketosteroid isomerase-like protein